MAYYLQMDGVDDDGLTPVFNWDEVVMDFSASPIANFSKYLSVNFNYIQFNSGVIDSYAGFNSVYVNGALVTNSTDFVPNDVRIMMRGLRTASNHSAQIFKQTGAGGYMRGKLYSVRFLLAGVTQAHYDMTLGNVQDQSGNSRHLTLTGGTWVDDGIPTGTAYKASLSDAIATSDSLSKRLSVAIIDVVNTSETESERTTKILTDILTTSDSFASTRGKAISVNDSIAITDTIRKALTVVKTDAINTAETERESTTRKLTDILTPSDAIILTGGKGVLLADSFTMSDTVKKTLSKHVAESLGIADSTRRNVSARIYDVIVTNETFSKQLPNAPTIIGTIALKGSRDLNVYLLGSRVMDVTLRGEL
ncbi:hypothetical protein BK120_08295 [Paenibacillus sp. FSL A5-0031]|uniref:hypothetical protein n=1 Tax=Paenibacillus sp. FSL A5-0031 TaxID=1920420 RepID=UPI00096C2AB0|nr:hypothetical protein [Paenibacillus sp. FSL A5-0031]OME86913.1 hypothetical protein BK120_08295 [Paenibacillus sp. FSL A5-0031]